MKRVIPNRKMVTVIGVIALMSAAVTGIILSVGTNSRAGAATTTPACGSSDPKLTVQATGQATATPNLLTLSIGVNVSDPTASAALTDANGRAGSLSATLEQAGVASADIQTANFSIQPNFDTKGAITGYQVSNTMLVKLHNLAASGAVIDAAARSAADAIRISGLTFSVDDTKTVDGTARADGIQVAAAHAHSMAAAAGESITGVCSITDSTTTYPLAQDFAGAGAATGATANSPSVPVQPGTQQSTAQVTVVYGLAPKG
ncbi:MAG TPA: SIMPL domain-containing protein [Acidimicrobiales bacterium]|jgi:hypothetical protein|nr:SIMPL domain-containing protein [Acidimicrobiales bacterium]